MTSENNGMVMPVAPYYGGGYGGNGGGFFDGNSGWWLILLLLVFGNGAWGNGFGGNGAGGMYPWLVNGQQNGYSEVQRGFDQNAVITGITGINNAVTSGFGNVQTALCSGFAGVNAGIAGVNAGIANGFAQAEIANNARQMASMQQEFANQTAMMTGFNGLQSQFANCCCENRLGLANLNSTILSENCADRAALSDGVRDILANQNNGIQRILDQMCADKIDSKNETIAQLRQELAMKDLAASQNGQTAAIQAGQRALANEIEQYVLPTPRPAYIVQNPACCGQQNYGCGCGCGFAG